MADIQSSPLDGQRAKRSLGKKKGMEVKGFMARPTRTELSIPVKVEDIAMKERDKVAVIASADRRRVGGGSSASVILRGRNPKRLSNHIPHSPLNDSSPSLSPSTPTAVQSPVYSTSPNMSARKYKSPRNISKRLSNLGNVSIFKPRDKEEEEELMIDGFSDEEEDSESEGEEDESHAGAERKNESREEEKREKEREVASSEDFIRIWFEKDPKKVRTEEEELRLLYLYKVFSDPPMSSYLLRLQAIARRIRIQKSYTLKIKRRNMIANEILTTERSYFQG